MNTRLLLGIAASAIFVSPLRADESSLENDFRNPPSKAQPFVWWHWLGPNFSKEGITKDLEAMKASGVGGATIFNITSSVMESYAPTKNNPWPDQTYRSPKYWEAVKHAASEAKRLGLELGLHNTVGYSTTGGPWIDEPRSMQHVVWSMVSLEGGRKINASLPPPPLVANEGWGKSGRKLSWFKDIAVLAVPDSKPQIQPDEIIDLTGKMDSNGNLVWEAPPGKWTVYRLAHASTGCPPHPVPDELLGKTLEADKISAEQSRYHWNQFLDPLKQHLGPLVGESMKHILIDSYEAGSQNWSPTFREDFKRLKGYDPLPWLMTFGQTVQNTQKPSKELFRTVGSPEQTARFENDYRDVISQLYYQNGWKPAADMIHDAGMILQHEAYGGPFNTVQGSALADVPMVEFWSGRKTYVNPKVIGAARAAGKAIIGAEAVTGSPMNSKWNEVPSFLKATLDGGYAGGVNRMVLHHWVHQPFDDRYKPGVGMGWWGTHFGRHQTWFEPGKDFFLYLGRVQAMLQKGETIVHHVSVGNSVDGGDAIPMDVLLEGVRVENGMIVLPSGRKYSVLHVPDGGKMLPEVAARIEKLLGEGATVVASKPSSSPSLSGYPGCDAKVREIASRVWGDNKEPVRKVGRGTLYSDNSAKGLKEALQSRGCEVSAFLPKPIPDIRVIGRTDGQASWFFIANLGDKPARFPVSFAVTGKLPELWNAETGTITSAPIWRRTGNRTEVDLSLSGGKSIFVVFRKPIQGDADPLTTVEAPEGWSVTATRDGLTHVESSNPISGTMRFASGRTKSFDLKPAPPIPLPGPWEIVFHPAIGKEFTASFPKLESFAVNENPEIKYFSGTATYKIRVDLPADVFQNGQRIQLDLGLVRDMAAVTVNGKPMGVWWHQPFSRDITEALHPGSNTLEIAVTNSWHNLLVGDEQYPADFEWGEDRGEKGRMLKGYPEWFLKNQPRPEQHRKAFTVWYYHRKETPLLPAGLIGPVHLVPNASAAAIPPGECGVK
jgi:hypothetical protein